MTETAGATATTTMGAADAPDATAVLVAVWRGIHLRLDDPPHVYVDDVGLRLADCPSALATLGAEHGPGEWWREPGFAAEGLRPYRALMVGRARFNDEMLGAAVREGVDQYVLLGAGLDSLAIRRPDLLKGVTVYEIDQPGAQRWKRRRLAELGIDVPAGVRFVPVDFEAGDDWTVRLAEAGYDASRPVFLSAVGLTQYINRAATADLLARCAALGPRVTLLATYFVPESLADPAHLPGFAQIREVVAARGCPFVADYHPGEIADLALEAGFTEGSCHTPGQLTERYFSGRADGLAMWSIEHILLARRG